MLFAQPARRPPPQPRSFRHQTNSFSFDSTERSSAVYDQELASSYSTNNSTTRPHTELSLDEELGGVSLEHSQTNSDDSTSEQGASDLDEYQLVLPQDAQDAQEEPGRDFIFWSSQLPLPPPFSTILRTVSGEEVVPHTFHPETSPVAIPSSSPPRSETEQEQTTPRSVSLDADRTEATPRSAVRFLAHHKVSVLTLA